MALVSWKSVFGVLLLFGSPINGVVLPDFLGETPLVNGSPWGNISYDGDVSHQPTPDTGVTRYYNLNVARATLSPDGYQKEMLVVNGQYPAPLIEANWGDWVEITVTNSIIGPEEGTALHWHGLRQRETPWYDGVPSVSQCPIAPGSNFTYRFRADHVGTSFYHSHYSAQISGGVAGPMVFYGPKSQQYDYDLGPVLLNDWFHTDYLTLVAGIMGNGTDRKPAISNNNLINGKNNFDCSVVTDGTPCKSNAGVSEFSFKSGKDHLLRVINGGSAGLQYFSIDEHELTVISSDFIPIEPFKTNVVTLGVGQRADIIVHSKKETAAKKAYWMRNLLSPRCALSYQPHGFARISYEKTPAGIQPNSQAQSFSEDRLKCANEALNLTTPLKAVPARPADLTYTIQVTDSVNATGHEAYLMNNQTFRGNYNMPILKLAGEGNFSYPDSPEWNVYSTGDSKVVRIVWENQKVDKSNPAFYNLTFAHPLHLHGHDFQVLSAGPGSWDGTIDNVDNPPRGDTHLLPPSGHLVVQFETDNPGVWPFHCHVAWHVSAGFYINILERPYDIPARTEIPGVLTETCAAWDAWSSNNVVNQIDSGLRRFMD
ncbi:putative multicopper oxidase [Xylaria venustula]|nr:putative multicopper oxidase [Xylaria venustula]